MITVRLATPEDAATIAAFNQRMAMETENKQLPDEQIVPGVKNLFRQPEFGFYVVAESAGEVIGCLMISYEWSDWRNGLLWWLQSVYVLPAYRKLGAFSSMLRFVEEAAQQKQVLCIRLYMEQHNQTANAVYLRNGFEQTDYLVFEKKVV